LEATRLNQIFILGQMARLRSLRSLVAHISGRILSICFFPHFAKIKKNLGSNKAQSNFYLRTDGAPSVASLPCRAHRGAYIINMFFPHFAKIKKNLGSNKAQSNFYLRTDGAPSVASLPCRAHRGAYTTNISHLEPPKTDGRE
jgi:hypothetical protein